MNQGVHILSPIFLYHPVVTYKKLSQGFKLRYDNRISIGDTAMYQPIFIKIFVLESQNPDT